MSRGGTFSFGEKRRPEHANAAPPLHQINRTIA